MDILTDEFCEEMYNHHLALYHERKEYYNEATSHSKTQVILYAKECIRRDLLTKEAHAMNLLPRVDFACLFGLKGNIAADGIE